MMEELFKFIREQIFLNNMFMVTINSVRTDNAIL